MPGSHGDIDGVVASYPERRVLRRGTRNQHEIGMASPRARGEGLLCDVRGRVRLRGRRGRRGRGRMGRWLADTASDHRACAPAAGTDTDTDTDTDRMMSESIQSGFTGAPYSLPFFAVTCPPVTTKAPMPTP